MSNPFRINSYFSNAEFLQYAIDFFKRIVEAKLKSEDITVDRYKKKFLNLKLSTSEIAINSGLNKKKIPNMYNSAKRSIVIEASSEHYDTLYNAIKELTETEHELDLKLTIKFRGVSVDLNVIESLIVINTIAVKRAEIRGGMWSAVGKQIEKPLIVSICKLFNVPFEYFDQKDNPKSFREVDFYILSEDGEKLRTEVKLMGKGNPESADAIFAREPKIFLADKLSEKNKKQADMLGVQWIELRTDNGYKRFIEVLKVLNVPYKEFDEDLVERIDRIVNEIYGE
ncbi:MAG: hypothetical protein AUK34_06090 [Ignavibacteria bacterium CG2_30_36_16]|nr:CfrBI family restriction endonuclease [Ignavibacteria bacterium]OIP60735.1 MAG: hypothetical protein AUK34_06090 [Ignavibacteria bacterium CG2_30_36_16]PJB00393.1 MAG: CfrBI family restriction endonuclease [Ignavibacteria bacterium CG_4_9_14_3_um_filter_36_18]